MAISSQFIDELVSRSDIADVVSGYVSLTKRSGSNMFGLCPFHSEKTPSFSVSPEKQIYHCFGCGKGGGVINFIMEVENLSFVDAIHHLAKRAGLTVPDDEQDTQTQGRRTRMLELNKAAARYFHDILKTPDGATAVQYITRRGISKSMVTRFGLGAAPDKWTALTDEMTNRGYTQQELLDAGLAKKNQKTGRVYDAFRNRLVFPVIDVRGSVIGFSGRILDDGEPKYLNSPETLVFNKSRNLFGLNLAKKTKRPELILAEGNIDVVALHQAGFDSAVASLGTSLTPDQARLMSRYTDTVVIAYDSDSAGVKAAQRAIGILEKTDMNVRVLKMDGAKDPDEFIKNKGADSFSLLLESSENHIEYQILITKAKHNLDTDDGRLSFMSEAVQLVSGLPSAIEREIYSARVAELAGVSADAVHSEVKKSLRRRLSAQKKKNDAAELRPSMNMQPKDKSIRYDNPSSAAAEEGIIRLLLLDAELIKSAEDLSESDFTSPFLAKLFTIIKSRREALRPITEASIATELSGAEASQLTTIAQKPESLANGERAMRDYIEKIRTEKLKKNSDRDLLAVSEKYREKKGYGG